MKLWNKRVALALFTGTLLVGSLSACAHRPDGGMRSGAEGGMRNSPEEMAKFRAKMVDRISSQLELNADQKTRLNTLADKLQEQRVAMRGKSPEPRTEMQALIAGDKFDRAKAQAMVGEKTSAITTKSPEVITALGDFYDSLNTTQQQKVREFAKRGHGRGWGMRG